jgi:hypothetical protein
MNYKKDIENLLFDLKSSGIDRSKIEHDLHYSPNYIDQVVAKGGNKRFYEALKSYSDRILQKTTAKNNIGKEFITGEVDMPYPNKDFIVKADLEKFIGERVEKAAAREAALKVIIAKIKKLESIVLKQPYDQVSLEFDRLAEAELKPILDELRKK